MFRTNSTKVKAYKPELTETFWYPSEGAEKKTTRLSVEHLQLPERLNH